jgi:diguanylate cyclase (GGDEF)-like protein
MIFLISLWSVTYYAQRSLRDDMQRLLSNQQQSTATFIATAVNAEMSTRIKALEILGARITPSMMKNPALLQSLLEDRQTDFSLFNNGIAASGIDGTVIAEYPTLPGRLGANFAERDYFVGPLKEGKVTVGRPVMSKIMHAPVFVIGMPIRDPQGTVIGVLGGITDLHLPNFLDNITHGQYGNTGGLFVASRQNRVIITASDKRRIMEQIPPPGVDPVIDARVAGQDNTTVFVNPRKVEVLSSAKSVPVANWFVVVSLPVDEAFAPLRDLERRLLMAAAFATMLTGVLTWLLLTRQLSPMIATAKALSALSDTGHPLQPLPIARNDEIGELVGGFNHLLELLKQREQTLVASERLLMDSQTIAGVGSYALDVTTGLWKSSPALDCLFGIDASYTRSVDGWEALIHPDDRLMMDHYFKDQVLRRMQTFDKVYRIIRHDNQQERWVHGLGRLEFNAQGVLQAMIGTIQDITERRLADIQIQSLAFSDPLTGLPNRRLLMDRLEQALAAAARHGHQNALLFIDLDDFKTINDTLGHDKGDSLLKQIARRLTACVRECDTVARLGGDEFVVLLEDLSSITQEAATQTQAVTAKILSTLGQPYEIEGHGHHSTASIGVTLFGGFQRESSEEPLKRAELAMYQAKAAGRNTLRFFEPEMGTAATNRATLEAELREAVNKSQFVLYYQPQGQGNVRLSGVEALVRWQHPTRGLVLPAEFIHVAESSGLILPLGRWVMETACKQLAAWAARPQMSHLTMAINVSARQFRQPGFVEDVLTMLNANGAKAEHLKLELTESVLVDNVEDLIIKMNALKARGIGFSIDDFGTGYSSLSYLKRLPLDQLKIDKTFVRDILTDPDDAAIARMVVALADSLGLSVIAEGVETEAQRDFLAKLGCKNYQGYLFSRPLPIQEFEEFAAVNVLQEVNG